MINNNYIIECLNMKKDMIVSIITKKSYEELINEIKKMNQKEIKLIYHDINKFLKGKRTNKYISNLKLNSIGLYLSRTIFSEVHTNNLLYNQKLLNKYSIDDELYKNFNNLDYTIKNYLKSFLEKGVIVIENFLDNEDYQELKKEYYNSMSKIKPKSAKATFGNTKKKDLSKLNHEIYNTFLNNKFLNEILKYCCYNKNLNLNNYKKKEKNSGRIFARIEDLEHISPSIDVQKTWHVDTFHPTCKFWLYMDDHTKKEKGPFEYIEGSHINTIKKLKYENKQVINILNNKINDESTSGSLRYYSHKIIESLGYKTEQFKQALYNENTLIIANTRAIHRRGHGEVGEKRYCIHGSIRDAFF